MASKLMSLDQCKSCKENVEFLLKMTISNLQLCGVEFKLGYEGLKLTVTLDGVVRKFDDLSDEDPVVCDLLFQATPENFNHKLHKSPIMLNFSRDKYELGTVKISIADCFADAVMCDEFEGQRFETEYIITKEKTKTCAFDLSLHITRKPGDCQEFSDYLKKRDRLRSKVKKIPSSDGSFDDDLSGLNCDQYLTTDDCPFDSDSFDASSFRPSTSKSKSSFKSKCRSDIATSIDSKNLKGTPCPACGGVSVSAITCENKELFSEIYQNDSLSKICESFKISKPQKCEIPVNRICSECFEDLSVVPHNAPCPKCDAYKRQLQRAVSFKSEKQQRSEQEKIRNCLRSIFEEILLGDKARVEEDMKRLKGERRRKKSCKRMKIEDVCGVRKKRERNPRCDKIKKILTEAREGFKSRHPGVVRGHKTCMLEAALVPKNMGWLWNVHNPGIPKIRRGWKPGAVPRKIAKIMKYFLTEKQPPAEPCPPELSDIKPGLHVQRAKGEYTIKMNPACGDGPITFKLIKTEDAKKREEARKILRKQGIEKTCKCNEIENCRCLSDCMKKKIIQGMKNISLELSLEPQLKFNELNESSDSEMDFKYTPSNIMTRSKVCKRPPVCNVATQYEAQKIEEVIIEEKKMELKKLQQAMKGNLKATKSSLKGGKIVAKSAKSEEKKKEIKKDVKKNIGASGHMPVPIIKSSQVKQVCNACTIKTCDVAEQNRSTSNYNPLCSQMPSSSTNYAAGGNLCGFYPSTCY